MADGTIFDQTQETALTAAHRLLVQDTSAATASQSATFALMGGLEHNAQTVTTADITGAVGQLYYCTIAGLTADRNLTLPASAQVGERIGVYIVDGDDTYELIIKGAATVTINGGSAATEWSRLFIAGEMVIFRCVSSTAWIVEYDGRIPSLCIATGTGTLTTTSTFTVVDLFTSADSDPHGLYDSVNSVIKVRRAGTYSAQYRSLMSGVASGATVVMGASLNSSTSASSFGGEAQLKIAATGDHKFTSSGTNILSADDTLSTLWYKTDATNRSVSCRMYVSEVL